MSQRAFKVVLQWRHNLRVKIKVFWTIVNTFELERYSKIFFLFLFPTIKFDSCCWVTQVIRETFEKGKVRHLYSSHLLLVTRYHTEISSTSKIVSFFRKKVFFLFLYVFYNICRTHRRQFKNNVCNIFFFKTFFK